MDLEEDIWKLAKAMQKHDMAIAILLKRTTPWYVKLKVWFKEKFKYLKEIYYEYFEHSDEATEGEARPVPKDSGDSRNG